MRHFTQGGAETGADFKEVLARLKRRGCAFLVCGEAPRKTFQQATRRMHGSPEETRYRVHALTGETQHTHAGNWLPEGVSVDDNSVEMFDYRADHRSITADGPTNDDTNIVSPMQAGPSFPGIRESVATVSHSALNYESKVNLGENTDEEQFWNAVARPKPAFGGQQPRKVKPPGDPNPSHRELEEAREFQDCLGQAIQDFGEDANPGELRLGISSLDPLFRSIGGEVCDIVAALRQQILEVQGTMFCHFPHPVTSPETAVLREPFDAVVLLRRVVLEGEPQAFVRYVIPEQEGITESHCVSGWAPHVSSQETKARGKI